MARIAHVLPPILSIPHKLSFAVISRAYPFKKITAALEVSGKRTQRVRSLPFEIVVYYIIAASLLMHVNLKEVLRYLFEGLRGLKEFSSLKIAGKSAISQARSNLGSKVMQVLYEDCVKPIATSNTKGDWYKEKRLVCLDGSTLDIPDEEVNKKEFGHPTTVDDKYIFPQIRFVSLAEAGTHVLFATAMGKYNTNEQVLAREVVPQLNSEMVCLADRGFFSYELWKKAHETGASLIWRARSDLILRVVRALKDGSYISYVKPRRPANSKELIPVRVVEYEIQGIEKDPVRYRIITNFMDEKEVPALDIAKLYHERWEIETIFDEFKAHLIGKRTVLRSKTPELIKQEFYGLLLAHYAIREIMHEAALEGDKDPDRLSYTHSLNIIRRKLPQSGAFPPSEK